MYLWLVKYCTPEDSTLTLGGVRALNEEEAIKRAKEIYGSNIIVEHVERQ